MALNPLDRPVWPRELYPTAVGHRSIRLAELLPSREWADDIACELHTVTPSDYEDTDSSQPLAYPKYKALSYAWGSPKGKVPILVNGIQVLVTVNLECALRHLRHSDKRVLLWVDALCINQACNTERTRQVARINDIYRAASEVVVSLADAPGHRIVGYSRHKAPGPQVVFNNSPSDDALRSQFLSLWQLPGRGRRTALAFDVICLLSTLAHPRDPAKPFESLQRISEANLRKLFESLRGMICSPWWDRIWVVQEIIVASKVTVQYGNVSAPWSMFSDIALPQPPQRSPNITIDSLSGEHMKVLSLFLRRVADIDRRRQTWRENRRPPLLSLLREFSSRKASDDRDKVYALLGLCHPDTVCKPHYWLSVGAVYQRTAIDAMRASRSLSVLSSVSASKNRQNLPSWVPDWSAAFDEHERRRADLVDEYDACGGLACLIIGRGREDYWGADFDCYEFHEESLEQHVCDQMSKLVESLRAATNPADLLPQFYAPALDAYKAKRGDRVNKLCDLLVCFCHPAGARAIETLADYSLVRHYGGEAGQLRLRGKCIGKVARSSKPLYSSTDLTTVLDTIHVWTRGLAPQLCPNDPSSSAGAAFAATLVSGMKITANGFESLQDEDERVLMDWYRQRIMDSPPPPSEEQSESPTADSLDSFSRIMQMTTARRAFFITTDKKMGMGPMSMGEGDELYLLPGGRVPVVLRQQNPRFGAGEWHGKPRTFSLIGDCYLHGAMDGSLSKPEFRPLDEGSLPEDIFTQALKEAKKILGEKDIAGVNHRHDMKMQLENQIKAMEKFLDPSNHIIIQ